MEILSRHPWHIDSLLQMSEVARHQEGVSSDSGNLALVLMKYGRQHASIRSRRSIVVRF